MGTGGVGSTACVPNVPYSIMSSYLIGCGYGRRWKYCVCTQCTLQHVTLSYRMWVREALEVLRVYPMYPTASCHVILYDVGTGGVGSTACAPNVPYSIMSRYLIGCGYGRRWEYCVCTQCTLQHQVTLSYRMWVLEALGVLRVHPMYPTASSHVIL